MDEQSVIDLLSGISVGSVIAWISVIAAIVGGLYAVMAKLYRAFLVFNQMRDEDVALKESVSKHDEQLDCLKTQVGDMREQLEKQLLCITNLLEEQRNTKIKELRHAITSAGEKALLEGKMTIREWSSLHEMYDEYTTRYHQNSYVGTLMAKVDRSVEIVGKLDEHGNDIE